MGMDEENPLEQYLNAPSFGAYNEQDLASTFNTIQGKLRSLNLPVSGDIFRQDNEHVKQTLKW